MKHHHPIELLRFPTYVSALLLTLIVSVPACGQSDSGKGMPVEPKITHTVVMNTTLGEIEIELYGEDAPMTVANFVELVDSGFYNGIHFHRIHPNFLIQAGDPGTKDSTVPKEKWGRGGTSIYGGPFPDEFNVTSPSYKRGYVKGILAMANNGSNTNLSQFFILLRDIPKLPKQNTIFGRVVRGIDIIDSIASVDLVDITDYGGRPKTPVIIINAWTIPTRQAARTE